MCTCVEYMHSKNLREHTPVVKEGGFVVVLPDKILDTQLDLNFR